MCPVRKSSKPARPQTAAFVTAANPAETDNLLREIAYVLHLTERVRKAITAGEELLPADV